MADLFHENDPLSIFKKILTIGRILRRLVVFLSALVGGREFILRQVVLSVFYIF